MHADDISALLPHLSRLDVERGSLLTEQGEEVDQVYFPTTAYLSNAVLFRDGRSAQTFVMGVEGVSGLAASLAEEPSAWRVEVRASGEVYSLSAAVLRQQADASPRLRLQLLRLTHDYQAQAAFTVGCASLHPVGARLANFILTTADRRGDDQLDLTQQDLADFLGIQRTTINSAANELKVANAIKYSRGVIRIVDRDTLSRHACECYQLQKALPLPEAA
ncbi:Crp/Fnr family transcriptional regulator [Brevundimonas sp.]|uniref:Crp/Fnr family transcriptional regulator n=1 Tax=Brevundimonas sp. TaxID=1871086 RepID=UPI002D669B08|nr:Crp/Fnr family transcriptional regulator [Brevundimonas sp.]HYC68836.1 Crp/Fnr family transcriptional regulator [Brevundimonas sp.]